MLSRPVHLRLVALLPLALMAITVAPGCGHENSPEGVVAAYAEALNSRDGDAATALLAPDFAPDGGRWLTAYARVMERYELEIVDSSLTGTTASVRVRERADLVMGTEEMSELEFDVTNSGGKWLISAIREVTAPTVGR